MEWRLSNRADPEARVIADRHYNRQKPGSPQFVPPGRCLVLLAPGPCLWVTSWPFAQYVKHAWAGAWMCSCYRREGGQRASDAIRDAVAATRWRYGEPPDLGMVTFLDPCRVRPIKTRGIETFGRTWFLAGFRPVGSTKGGLLAFQLLPCDMPDPYSPADARVTSSQLPLLPAVGGDCPDQGEEER